MWTGPIPPRSIAALRKVSRDVLIHCVDLLAVLDGLVMLEVPVSDHPDTQRHTNKRDSDQEVAEHPQEECTSGQWWVTTMFVHSKRAVGLMDWPQPALQTASKALLLRPPCSWTKSVLSGLKSAFDYLYLRKR